MTEFKIIDITPENVLEYGMCGYKSLKKPGYPEKVSWLKEYAAHGLKVKSIVIPGIGMQGMIEYLPGEYCWRPVDAEGYLFIHCLFVGFKKQYKGKGYAGILIDQCINDARQESKNGVAVVTRKGSFMVGNQIFRKKGFDIVDKAPPDFELLVYTLKNGSPIPKYKNVVREKNTIYQDGLTIIRADQCPYTRKNVDEIMVTAEKEFRLKPRKVDLKNHMDAQESPCPFGVFCIIYNGQVISHHPISNRRFFNIMSSIMKNKSLKDKI